MKKTTIIILLFFLFGDVSAQYTPKQIDSLLSLAKDFEKGDDMDWEKSISIAQEAYEHSKKINYKAGIGSSSFLISAINFNLGNNEEVIIYSSIAKESIDKSNYFQLIENLRTRAMSLINLGYTENAREELKKALLITNKIENPHDRKYLNGSVYEALGFYFYHKTDEKSKDSLLYYSKKAYKVSDEILKDNPAYKNIENSLALASVNVALCYLDANKHLDSVEFYLNRGLSLSKKTGHIFVEYLVYRNLGEMYFLQKEYERSISFYLEGLSVAKKINNPLTIKGLYKDISKVYDASGNDIKAKEYLARYVKLNDSITEIEKKAIQLPMKQLLSEKEKNFVKSKFRYTQVIAIFLLIVLLFACLSYSFFKKFRTEKMSKKEKEMLLIEKKMEIDKINDSGDERLNNIIQLAINDNPVFYIRFQEFYSEFCDMLKFKAPSLTLGELKCCALLKLNFSTKEIARFTRSTVRAIEQRKYRIRKKLDIPSDEDMNIWMMNL